MERLFLILGAVLAGLAVAAGAFGAHGLETRVTPERLEVFETAARYQMYHALALLLAGILLRSGRGSARLIRWSGLLMLAGVLLFSGSLYVLVLTDTSWLGAVTPFGGVLFLIAWALLALAFCAPRAPSN
jgi:uncharacterized membrane protein YgdD (TMEM256/DUF423 family)